MEQYFFGIIEIGLLSGIFYRLGGFTSELKNVIIRLEKVEKDILQWAKS